MTETIDVAALVAEMERAADGYLLHPQVRHLHARLATALQSQADALAEARRALEIAERDVVKFQAIAEDKLADTRLVNAGGRVEGGFGFDFTGGPIPYITEYLFQFIGARDEKGPSNYAEIEVNHSTFGAMTLTLQRHSGKTPHQLRAEFETRATTAEASLATMQEALKPFAGEKMPSLRKTVRDYNEFGLRCMMSPMEIAMLRARRALGGSNAE